MRKTIDIWPEELVDEGEKTKISAVIELPGGARETIWYKIPSDRKLDLSETADPFLIGSIFLGMAQNADLYIHSGISSTLLANLEEYQAIWNCWKPNQYKLISINSDREILSSPDSNGSAIIPFSGGVDSCFSVYRHTQSLCGRRNKTISSAVMIHGSDIPLSEAEMYFLAAQRSKRILDDVNVPLVQVSTNWRALQRSYKLSWEDCHASSVIAVLSLFQGKCHTGLIATGDISYKKIVWGSNPLSDPLLSTGHLTIIPDGASFRRVEKVALIASWEIALQNLRVCWRGKDYSENCCKCGKCIQTILDFRVTTGKLPKCFDTDVEDEDILTLPIHSYYVLENLQGILDYAKLHDLSDESWVKALQSRVNRYHSREAFHQLKHSIKSMLRRN